MELFTYLHLRVLLITLESRDRIKYGLSSAVSIGIQLLLYHEQQEVRAFQLTRMLVFREISLFVSASMLDSFVLLLSIRTYGVVAN